MKKITTTLIWIAVLILGAGLALAQDDDVDRVTVELSNPGQPAVVEVSLVGGGISVTAYNGQEIIIEARSRMNKLDRSHGQNSKAKGMIKIPVNSSSLSVEEYHNVVEISTDSWKNPIDLDIKVPRNTSLKLSCVNSGDIYAEGVTGEVEAENVNGKVTLVDISGSAVAHAHNGNVTVNFMDIDPDKDMSFTSFNGDVDVTFPATLKAKVKLKNVMGEIFSDFEVTPMDNPSRVIKKNDRHKGGKYEVQVERAYWGVIGGSADRELTFSNYNGDIYIRSGK